MYKYNAFTGKLDIVNDNNVILQEGTIYPTPTSSQLASSVTYIGYNYPSDMRVGTDVWQKMPSPITQTAITDISTTELRLNWNVPTYIDYLGNTVNADVFGYVWQVSTTSTFATILQSGTTTATTILVTGLTAETTYYSRILNGSLEDGVASFSNVVTADTTAVSNIFDGLVVLNPTHLYNLRNVEVGDATVPNLGSAGGTATKTGTFTKNVGLVGSTDSFISQSFTNVPFGNSVITGSQDWVLGCKVKYPDVGTTLHSIAIHANTAASDNRMRVRSGSVADDGVLLLTRSDAPAGFSTASTIGTTRTPNAERVLMFVKDNDEIKVYEDGSTTATQTIAVGATTEFNFDRLLLLSGLPFGGAGSDGTEMEYAFLHHVDEGTLTNASDYINLMTLSI